MQANVLWTLIVLAAASVSRSQASILVAFGTEEETSFSVRVSNVQQPAVAFTVPAETYRIDSVTLNLRDYSSASDTPVIAFYKDNGGRPGNLLGAPLLNPPSDSNRSADFTFIPNGTLAVSAGQTYWVQASSAAGWFSWNSTGERNQVRAFGAASFTGYKVGLNAGEIYVEDHPVPSFSISATAVPEPTMAGLLAMGLAIAVRRRLF